MDKIENLDVDFEELEKEKKENTKQRKWFIDYWVDYIKTHSDEEWGKQHAVIINAQIPQFKEA